MLGALTPRDAALAVFSFADLKTASALFAILADFEQVVLFAF
jgi:hypothetical protein